MADESIIDKAIALIPGVAPKKRKTPAKAAAANHQTHLKAIQKSLAALVKDVEKLAAMVGSKAKAAEKKVVGAKTTKTSKASRASKSAKKPAARKTAARKPRKTPATAAQA